MRGNPLIPSLKGKNTSSDMSSVRYDYQVKAENKISKDVFILRNGGQRKVALRNGTIFITLLLTNIFVGRINYLPPFQFNT